MNGVLSYASLNTIKLLSGRNVEDGVHDNASVLFEVTDGKLLYTE
jgi:hypothetical protein